MTDHAESAGSQPTADGATEQLTQPEPPAAGWLPEPVAASHSAQESVAAAVAERPELAVGAAFAGGLLAALILKRLAR